MNLETMKFTKILAASALGLSAFLAGCSETLSEVTAQNAPSELLKKAAGITGESDPVEVQEVFQGLVDATGAASDNRLIITENASGTGLKLDSETLETTDNVFKSYDVRYGTDVSFFQLYEELSQGESVYGLMDSSDTTITTLYLSPENEDDFGKDNAVLKIDSIDTRESGLAGAPQENLKASIDNAIIYPLYSQLGSSLVIQPMGSPENYDFKLEKSGSSYIWTISIADQKLYNETLDSSFEAAYGHARSDIRGDGTFILDTYDVTNVTMVLTMDSQGALSKIESVNESEVSKDGKNATLSSRDTVTIEQAPTTWKSFFESFFKEVSENRLKEEDTFRLLESFDESSKTESKNSSASSSTSSSSASSSEAGTSQKSSSQKSSSEKEASEKDPSKDSSKSSADSSK